MKFRPGGDTALKAAPFSIKGRRRRLQTIRESTWDYHEISLDNADAIKTRIRSASAEVLLNFNDAAVK